MPCKTWRFRYSLFVKKHACMTARQEKQGNEGPAFYNP
jgi:hypothetical protein